MGLSVSGHMRAPGQLFAGPAVGARGQAGHRTRRSGTCKPEELTSVPSSWDPGSCPPSSSSTRPSRHTRTPPTHQLHPQGSRETGGEAGGRTPEVGCAALVGNECWGARSRLAAGSQSCMGGSGAHCRTGHPAGPRWPSGPVPGPPGSGLLERLWWLEWALQRIPRRSLLGASGAPVLRSHPPRTWYRDGRWGGMAAMGRLPLSRESLCTSDDSARPGRDPLPSETCLSLRLAEQTFSGSGLAVWSFTDLGLVPRFGSKPRLPAVAQNRAFSVWQLPARVVLGHEGESSFLDRTLFA